MSRIKVVAKIGNTIRIVEHNHDGNIFYKIEEIVTPAGDYIEWVTPAFGTMWGALNDVSTEMGCREFKYRSK